MFSTIALIAAGLIAAVVAYAATRPDTFRIQRSAHIDVAPEVVFSNINDFRKWEAWSPWEAIDPKLERSYSGAAKGVGAAYAWVGNKSVGTGRMEIVDARSPSAIRIKLDFTAPFAASNVVEFTLTKEADGTRVNWAMTGPKPFISKLMGLVFNMDKIVGGQFAQGLSQLKQVSEGSGYTKLMR
jgi:carbon monoxide dehydrogenase subunit G